MARRKVMFILPPSSLFLPVRFGIECSHRDCVVPRIKTIAPLPRGSFKLSGAVLCFIRKSRWAPSENEAIAGSGPRNLSSSLW